MSKFSDWIKGDNLYVPPAPVQDGIASQSDVTPKPVTRGQNFDVPSLTSVRNVGDDVTIETALTLSAVYRSVNALATIVSQLELMVLNSVGNPTKVPDIISRPDYTMPLSTWLKQTTTSLALTGNAYWRLYRTDQFTQPTRIEVLNPRAMSIEYDAEGNKSFVYSGYRTGKAVRLQPYQVSHLKLMEVFGDDYGRGPIQSCRPELTHALDLRDYAHRVFQQYPAMVISTEGYLDPDSRAEIRSQIYTELQAGERILPIGGKATIQFLEQDPEKTQYLSAQKQSDARIVRMFGMPPNMVLAEDLSSKTYQNMQDVDRTLVRSTVEQYITEIENQLNVLLPNTRTVKFNTEAWLRALTANDPAVNAATNEGGPVQEDSQSASSDTAPQA